MSDGSRSARSAHSTPRDGGDALTMAFLSPRRKTAVSPRKSSSGNTPGNETSRPSRSKNGKREALSSSSSSNSIQQVPVIWPGHKRPQFDAGTNDVSVDTLHEWAAIVQRAKSMGASQCVLCGLVSDKDYVFEQQFVFVPNSPYERLDAWREMHYVTFSILVPQATKNAALPGYPQYPRDYYRCGVLVADWFLPHPKMIKENLAPVAYTEEYLTSQLPVFDRIIARAKAAGQTECALMTIQHGSGYTYEATISSSQMKQANFGAQYRYTLVPEFQCVMDWALRHGLVIDVRVPQKPITSLGGFSIMRTPCSYGWIVVTWAIVLE